MYFLPPQHGHSIAEERNTGKEEAGEENKDESTSPTNIKRLTTDEEEESKKATSSLPLMLWRERNGVEGDENRKRGERADGGVSGWKKRARTEHSRRRRRRRRPMKKSLVAPAGLANILLSNTRATHTPPLYSVHPSRNHYPCRFFLVAWPMAAEKRKREEKRGRKREGEVRGKRGRGVALA